MQKYLFRKPRPRRWRALAAILAFGALTLAGCSAREDDWPRPAPEKHLAVGSALLAHEVVFSPGTTTLAAGESERLEAFLRELDTGYGDAVFMAEPAAGDLLARARHALVAETLARAGIDVSVVPAARSDIAAALDLGPARAERLDVRVRRHRVVLPDCPDWRKSTIGDFSNTPSSNFGCATLTNLGLMVADPLDLKGGRALAPAEASRAAAAVAAYRKGEQPVIPKDAASQPIEMTLDLGQP